ncbi:MAG: hypothetical protein JWN48_3987 [Myxococcaceae bacterium]|nr:hypothetical protein [Myxococcaceae bacterium]
MRFDDYLLRAIEQFTQSIARIVRALRGDQEEEAEREIAGAYDALLGNDRVFLDMVDPATLANLLGSPAKVRVLAQLSTLEAKLLEKRGQAGRAQSLRERALTLLAIAGREDPQAGDDRLLGDLD